MQPHGAVAVAVVAQTIVVLAEMAVAVAVLLLPKLVFPLEIFLPSPLQQQVERVEQMEQMGGTAEILPSHHPHPLPV